MKIQNKPAPGSPFPGYKVTSYGEESNPDFTRKIKHNATYDIVFRSSPAAYAIDDFGSEYSKTVLPAGHKGTPERKALSCDMILEKNIRIPMRDGVHLYANLFRPTGEEKVPVILNWTPFNKGPDPTNTFDGKRLVGFGPEGALSGYEVFEGIDPAWWVDHGYAVAAVDVRGAFYSEGDGEYFGNGQDANDGYDAVEWFAGQDWCNGAVAFAGNSWLAICQWYIAGAQPPHLKCIAPWEGHGDMYRCEYVRGGIPNIEGSRAYVFPGGGYQEDIREMIRRNPLLNDYWKSKIVPYDRITVPAYIVSSFSNITHGLGTYECWNRIASKEKWLRIHNINEWADLYKEENCVDLKKFFDHYMKGINNGWENTPTVRMCVLDYGKTGGDVMYRMEKEWPISRRVLKKLYLHPNGTMSTQHDTDVSVLHYDTDMEPVHCGLDYEAEFYGNLQLENHLGFSVTFDRDTEINGYIKLHAWMAAMDSDDMDVFVRTVKIGSDGKIQMHYSGNGLPFPGPDERLRVSLRRLDPYTSTEECPVHTYDTEEKLKPGEIVPIDIMLWPTGQIFHAGETLTVMISGFEWMGSGKPLPLINHGKHALYMGGRYDSYVMIPIIPQP